MDKKDFYFLGKVIKTSGYKGSLVFFFDVDDLGFYSDIEAVFIEINNELVPFAIKELKIKSNKTAYVSLEDVTEEEEALALVGNSLYLPLSFLPPLTGKKFYYHEIIGFNVIAEKEGFIGKIQSVMDQSGQGIFIIQFKGKEVLVPVVDEIINKIDRKAKTIEVILPEGLMDIYL